MRHRPGHSVDPAEPGAYIDARHCEGGVMVAIFRKATLLTLAVGALVATTVIASAIPAEAATLFADDFSDGVPDGWTTTNGAWTVAAEDGNPAFQQSDTGADARAISNITGR